MEGECCVYPFECQCSLRYTSMGIRKLSGIGKSVTNHCVFLYVVQAMGTRKPGPLTRDQGPIMGPHPFTCIHVYMMSCCFPMHYRITMLMTQWVSGAPKNHDMQVMMQTCVCHVSSGSKFGGAVTCLPCFPFAFLDPTRPGIPPLRIS